MKPAPLNKATRPDRKPAWASWYGTARWQKARARQLAKEPWCRICAAGGVRTKATVADHIEPHRGDYDRFIRGPFQSLCATCHNSTKQSAEKRGVSYLTMIGPDGLPIDPSHPFNAK